MKFSVSYRGTTREVVVSETLEVGQFQRMVEEETGIAPDFQKLLVARGGLIKVSKLENGDKTPINAVVKDGGKVTVIGTSAQQIQGLREAEVVDAQRKEKLNKRLTNMARYGRRPAISRDITQTMAHSKYTFDRVEPLDFLPKPEEARAMLLRIKNDAGVQAIMERYKWRVGLLTELDPALNTTHESRKLGQNRNKGQVIEIRIRTDDYAGWCDYKEIIKVVCHELAHNEYSEHDRNFWNLCNKLEREVKNLDPFGHRGKRIGDEVYNGPGLGEGRAEELQCDEGGLVGGTHILGGGPSTADEGGSVRDKLRKAAERRRED